jgi:hypothetical protein
MTYRLHTRGISSLSICDPTVLAEAALTHNWTFERRIEHLINLLCYWKTKCLALIKGNGLAEFVATPLSHMEGSLTNFEYNNKHQEVIEPDRTVQGHSADDQANVSVAVESAEAEQEKKDDARATEEKAAQEAKTKEDSDAKAAKEAKKAKERDAKEVKETEGVAAAATDAAADAVGVM